MSQFRYTIIASVALSPAIADRAFGEIIFGAEQSITSSAAGVTSVLTVDLDGDGDTDSLYVGGSTIFWSENLGLGTFSAKQEVASLPGAVIDIASVDLDQDGDFDVVSASGSQVLLHENTGAGDFGPAQVLAGVVSGLFQSIDLADLDGDGDLDLLASEADLFADVYVNWYENNGGGVFGQSQLVAWLFLVNEANVCAADLDGDGDLDVLTAGGLVGQSIGAKWYPNQGGGVFGGEELLGAGGLLVAVSDLDGDGAVDVVSAGNMSSEAAWYRNLGSGNFDAAQTIATNQGGFTSIATYDIDADGREDVVFTSAADDEVAWCRNLGSGAFDIQRIISRTTRGAASIAAGDIDSDGSSDVVAVSPLDGTVGWFRNEQGAYVRREISTEADFVTSVASGDLDGDGDTDVAFASLGDGRITWCKNEGSSSFGPQQLVASVPGARGVRVADLDQDGDSDILCFVGSFGGNGLIAWFANDGSGGFGAQGVVEAGLSCEDAGTADLDGDGDLDIIASGNGPYRVGWHENLGGGFFGPASVIFPDTSLPLGSWSISVADFDGDGDLDVVATLDEFFNGSVAWFENLGGGVFGPRQNIDSSSVNVAAVSAADVDGDGDMDVITSGPSSNLLNVESGVFVYENLGAGSFGPRQRLTPSLAGYGLLSVRALAHDFDGDGDVDLVAPSPAPNEVVLLDNLGSGLFSQPIPITQSSIDVLALHIADLDGDSVLDIVSSSRGDETVAWHRNPRRPDCNGNAVPDDEDLAAGTSFDCNANGIPDECELASGAEVDCNGNGIPDSCEIAAGAPDCNANGVLDSCEIAAGDARDCNANGVPDSCDIAAGMADCDGNGIPDGCDLALGSATDCDGNGALDACDIAAGAADCDADGILDSCQIFADLTLDLNGNGDLDACEAIGSNYCSPAVSNSTGGPAQIFALGSSVAASNDLTLYLRGLPLDTFAMFLTSQSQGYAFPIPGSQGALCVVGFPGRFNRPGQILSSGFSGTLRFVVNLGSIPTPSGFTAVVPGQTWNFQAWYRDANPTVTSNFTDAVSITFQ